jgi:hypothetical protein
VVVAAGAVRANEASAERIEHYAWCLDQLGQADQVVGSGREGERPAHPCEAAQAGARLAGNGLDPGEGLLIRFLVRWLCA